MCGNNCFNGNNLWWIIILCLLFCNCGGGFGIPYNNGCGCANPYDNGNGCGNGCGCGC